MNTHKILAITFALAAAAVAGCSDDDPAATAPSANGVFPANGFSGRQLRVEISGDSTKWSPSATVAFGDGVTVGTVTQASPTDLFADITIADSAVVGPRDVTVTDGGKTYTLTQAFEVVSPVTVTTTGSVAQGSVAGFTIRALDFEKPFDTTCGFSFFGQCFLYTGVTISSPAGTKAVVGFVGDYVVQGSLFIDTDAAGAGGALSVSSGVAGTPQVVSTAGEAVTITSRTAVALTGGTAANGTIANSGESGLYKFSAAANTSVPFVVTTQATQPGMYLLPSSGHFADVLEQGSISDTQGNPLNQVDAVATAAGDFYLIYVDDGSTANYSVKASPVTLTALAENDGGAGNNTSATAQTATKTALVTGGTLNGLSDQDWFQITVVAGDAGKHVHVTTSGDPGTDALVDVFSGPAAANSLGESSDAGYQEDFQSDPIPAATTTIFVEISASQAGFFNAQHNTYSAAIWLE